MTLSTDPVPFKKTYHDTYVIELVVKTRSFLTGEINEHIVHVPCKDAAALRKTLIHVYVLMNCTPVIKKADIFSKQYIGPYYDTYIRHLVEKTICDIDHISRISVFYYSSNGDKFFTTVTIDRSCDDEMIREILYPMMSPGHLKEIHYPEDRNNIIHKIIKP